MSINNVLFFGSTSCYDLKRTYWIQIFNEFFPNTHIFLFYNNFLINTRGWNKKFGVIWLIFSKVDPLNSNLLSFLQQPKFLFYFNFLINMRVEKIVSFCIIVDLLSLNLLSVFFNTPRFYFIKKLTIWGKFYSFWDQGHLFSDNWWSYGYISCLEAAKFWKN